MQHVYSDRAATMRRYYQAKKREGKFHGTIKRAMELWGQRRRNRPRPPANPGKYQRLQAERRSRFAVVPLSEEMTRSYLAMARRLHPRYQEWSHGCFAAHINSAYSLYETGDNKNWNRRSTFRRGVQIRSVAQCPSRDRVVLRLFDQTHVIGAPRGYRWKIDGNGLGLFGKAGDYHPDAGELVAAMQDKGRALVIKLKENGRRRAQIKREERAQAREEKRKAAQKKRLLREAEQEGATVCLADSVRAGNCSAGSQNWATAHGLDPKKHYKPSQVLALANGQTDRVAIVVAVALRRHHKEMERGYCELSEHRVQERKQ